MRHTLNALACVDRWEPIEGFIRSTNDFGFFLGDGTHDTMINDE